MEKITFKFRGRVKLRLYHVLKNECAFEFWPHLELCHCMFVYLCVLFLVLVN